MPISQEQLEPLVLEGLAYREIADRLECSPTTVRYWIARYALPTPIEVRNRERDERIASGERTMSDECGRHGRTTFVIESSGRTRCRQCRQDRVVRWRQRVKRRLVDEAGGACEVCGYSRYVGALQFHHLDPATKRFGLSARGLGRSLADLRAEAAKCALLCGNCHAEVEAGLVTLPLE